jgi:hypothetical protein
MASLEKLVYTEWWLDGRRVKPHTPGAEKADPRIDQVLRSLAGGEARAEGAPLRRQGRRPGDDDRPDAVEGPREGPAR